MTPDERDALRALHRALVVLAPYHARADLHHVEAVEVAEVLGIVPTDSEALSVDDEVLGQYKFSITRFGALTTFGHKETP